MGVSSRLRFDDRYRDFFQLVKSQVAATIAHAQAYENERERAEALAELDRAKTAFRLLLERERAARNEAENANRLKDEFLSTVSHELRTPLSAILGWTFLLREGALDPAMAQRAIEGLERNAHAQEKLVQDLLDVSRIVTGKLRLDLEQVNLSQVIASALDVARPSAKDKGVTIDSSGVPDLGTIWGDSSRLQQIFWNLLSNSIKFTPKGGQARLTVEQAPTHISISVIDTGTGIEGDFLPFIFERFRQADSSLSRRYGGLGLGLAIVRRLVELHGGTVSAQSAGVDKGATFTVCLPAGATPESLNNIVSRRITDTHATPSEISPVLTGVEVLLVEDFADAQEFLSTILERAGAHVTAVASAAEAWTALDGSRFDVMLSDIEMPVEDGYTLIRRIRQGAPNIAAIPAAALSAHARPEERDHALLDGFNMHIAKPVDPYTLIHSVARLAGRPETGLGTGTGT
jgi:signal transduction histidine kinase/CheY-like chemotaxis protein